MVGGTILHYKILEKLGEPAYALVSAGWGGLARRNRLLNKRGKI
ncbi:MAG TPA: hypothetical protein VJ954_06465 [Ignavibacteriaceae bacterium]|nr:hypothetical protein [Ignavibacteriaceae bacterium]